jgi:hypothetical protein
MVVMAVVLACMTRGGSAAVVALNWSGGDGGTPQAPLAWNQASNWTPAEVPDRGNEVAIFPDAAAARCVATPDQPTQVIQLTITQTSDAKATYILGSDLTINRAYNSAYINNSASRDNLVLDLNGHTFAPSDLVVNKGAKGITITSSAPGAVYRTYGMHLAGAAWTDSKVGPGITFEATSVKGINNLIFLGGEWDQSNTLRVLTTANDGKPGYLRALPKDGIGNLIVGDPDSEIPAAIEQVGYQQGVMKVIHDVTLNASSTGEAAKFEFRVENFAVDLRVGGNFTDAATDASGYGPQTERRKCISFDGGAESARTVSIGRTGIATDFSVGAVKGNPGHIRLDRDLTTTGFVHILAGSRLDLVTHTLTAARLNTFPGFALDLTCGETTGVIHVTQENGLKLAAFTLNLTKAGNWKDGDSLILIKYTGTPIAAPTITLGNIPAGMSYDKVMTDNGMVYLTNVKFLPEPASRDANVNGSLASTAP